jgi:hypothetical protein
VARLAGLLIELVAVLRWSRAGWGTRRADRLDLEGRIVLAGHRHTGERLHALVHALLEVGFLQYLLFLGLARNDPGQGEQRKRNRHQKADNQTERVEKVGVLLAHNATRATGKGPLSAAEYSGRRGSQ